MEDLKIGDKVILQHYNEQDRVELLNAEGRSGNFCDRLDDHKYGMISKEVIIDDITPNFISWCDGRWLKKAVKKVAPIGCIYDVISKSTEHNRPKPIVDTMHPIDRAFYEDRITAMRTATDTAGPDGGPKLKPILKPKVIDYMTPKDVVGQITRNDMEARKYAGM